MSGASTAAAGKRLAALRRAVVWRELAIVAGCAVPLVLGAAALIFRASGTGAAVAAAAVALIGVAALWGRGARAIDAAWLARRLNAALPALEDSAELLAAAGPATGLAGLQQQRVAQRFGQLALPELRRPLRRPFPGRWLRLCWAVGALLAVLAVQGPSLLLLAQSVAAHAKAVATPAGAATAVVDAAIAVEPPAYTGLPPRRVSALEGKAPAGSRLTWNIQFDRQPGAAVLVFQDGGRLELHKEGDAWSGERLLESSLLYRLELADVPPIAGDRLYRFEAVPDLPPEVIVRAPDKTLNLLADGQKSWDLRFEARDDYGLGEAELTVALAQGSGEQIKVTERKLVLDGGSDPHRRNYRKTLDLDELGFAKGDDLIVRLAVSDNHPPTANRTTSASFILRWPAAMARDSAGMDGMVQKVTPAYFRSERQIIIDTEALLAQRGQLDAAHYESRSDSLGVDQKILRLRYGEFLGEEFEGGAENAPQAATGVQSGKNSAAKNEDDKGPSAALKLQPPDHLESTANPPAAGFGQAGNILAEYGHIHDKPEAATLLDPATKRLLKAALDAMWQAELQLRQAQPDEALPYEYKALDQIKEVQAAERIYLARSGLDLPKVDASRRLSGDRKGLSDRSQPVSTQAPDGSPLAAAWQGLNGRTPDPAAPATVSAWVRQHQDQVPDALGVLAAAERLQRAPDCGSCREDLRARLWPLLPAPAGGVAPRAAPDAAGDAYLRALGGGAAGAAP